MFDVALFVLAPRPEAIEPFVDDIAQQKNQKPDFDDERPAHGVDKCISNGNTQEIENSIGIQKKQRSNPPKALAKKSNAAQEENPKNPLKHEKRSA